jgi:hypothetical protein
MRRLAAVLTFVVLVPCTLQAQAQTTVEIGTGIGSAIIFEGGETITQIGVPGPGAGAFGILGQAPIYATFLMGQGMMVQPEFAFNLLSGGGTTITSLNPSLHLGYAFMGAGANSPYVTANGALQLLSATDTDTETIWGIGGRLGYRVVVNPGFATSFEAGYRRWLGVSGYNELTFGIRLGGIVSSPK